MRVRLPLFLPALLALALGGCGGGPYLRQARGDGDGVPVRIEVLIAREYVRDLRNRGPGGREVVVYGSGFMGHGGFGGYPYGHYHGPYYGHGHYPYDPYWYGDLYSAAPAPTTVYLLGGDGPGQARLLRTELDYGTNLIDVAIRPGRRVTLTVQAYGGYEGWEEVGTFTAADRPGQRVVLDLTEHAPHLHIANPDGTFIDVVPAPSVPPASPVAPVPPVVPAQPAPPAPPVPDAMAGQPAN